MSNLHFPKQEIKKDGQIFSNETMLSTTQKPFNSEPPKPGKEYDNKGKRMINGKFV